MFASSVRKQPPSFGCRIRSRGKKLPVTTGGNVSALKFARPFFLRAGPDSWRESNVLIDDA
jgi:hypothetical protein